MSWRRLVVFALTSLCIGCNEKPSTDDTKTQERAASSRIEKNKQAETRVAVSLRNPYSVKRFLEAELGLRFEESTLGFSAKTQNIKAEIWTDDSKSKAESSVIEFQVLFEPLSDDSIEKCLKLTRRILSASGENVYEVEDKVDKGRVAFLPDNDDHVELRFGNGSYVRFSKWIRGEVLQAGVVISPR